MAEDAKVKACFVIAEMGAPASPERKRSDQILRFVIQPAAEACGYRAEWPPDISHPGTITHQVIERLLNDPLVIADLTNHNPNVFYELAIRHAVRLPLVQIIQQGQTIPFDIAPQRTIQIDFPDPDGIATAVKELVKHIHAAEQDPSHVDNPLANAIDLSALRSSGKPADAQLLQVVEAINQLREDVAQLRASVRQPRVLPGTGGLQNLAPAPARRFDPEFMEIIQQLAERSVKEAVKKEEYKI